MQHKQDEAGTQERDVSGVSRHDGDAATASGPPVILRKLRMTVGERALNAAYTRSAAVTVPIAVSRSPSSYGFISERTRFLPPDRSSSTWPVERTTGSSS